MTEISKTIQEMLQDQYGIKAFRALSRHGNTVNGQGSKLIQLNSPDLEKFSGIFVEIPIDVSLEISDGGTLEKVNIIPISDQDIGEAVSNIKRLIRKDQIQLVSKSLPNATHVVETDHFGRQILTRLRYS